MKLLNLTVKPHPILIPGVAHVEVTIHIKEDLIGPLKVSIF